MRCEVYWIKNSSIIGRKSGSLVSIKEDSASEVIFPARIWIILTHRFFKARRGPQGIFPVY